jgi:hypothetical protein
MMALFRCIYDLPCDEPSELAAYSTTLEFLAKICVVAEKYQVEGVQAKIAEQMEGTLWVRTENIVNMNSRHRRKSQPEPDDLLAAIKVVFNGTSQQDNVCRVTLVKFCVLCIRDLKRILGFSKLLSECGELGAAIIAHDSLSLSLEGSWGCDDCRFRQAVPRCPKCKEKFSMSYIRNHRDESEWTCESGWCDATAAPMCLEWDEHCPAEITWEWEE